MSEAYEGWAVVELMGHRRLGGYVRQAEQFGVAMLRLDVPEHPWNAKYEVCSSCGQRCTEHGCPDQCEDGESVLAKPLTIALPDGMPDDGGVGYGTF